MTLTLTYPRSARQKLAQNLNADEAAVMGAALYGATKSSQFRTKDIRLTPMILHKIERAFEAGEHRNVRFACRASTV